MLVVKITLFLIIITVVYWVIAQALITQESLSTRLEMSITGKFPKYFWALIVLICIDAVGVICSVCWALFLR